MSSISPNCITAVQADLGRRVSPVLLNAIRNCLHEKTIEWMEKNSIPQEVIDSVILCETLQRIGADLQAHKADDLDAADLPGYLFDAQNLSECFGGEVLGNWYAGESTVPPVRTVKLTGGRN